MLPFGSSVANLKRFLRLSSPQPCNPSPRRKPDLCGDSAIKPHSSGR